MDDDGRPMNSQTLCRLTEKIGCNQLEHKPFILNSIVLCDDENMTFGIRGISSLKDAVCAAEGGMLYDERTAQINPFNGTLLSRKLVEAIGFPNGQLIIYGDEADYASRAVKANAFVATVVDSLYYHPKNNSGKTVFGREIIVMIGAKWRYYYSSRNNTYSLKNESKYMIAVKQVIKMTICILLADDKKIQSLGYVWKGFFDGIRGKLGPVVGPMAE